MNKSAIVVLSVFLLASCTNADRRQETGEGTAPVNTGNEALPLLTYTVANSYPHDTTSFTEGFLVHEGLLFESTGHTDSYASSRSLFGVVDLKSGMIAKKAEIDREKYFGEGIVFLKDKIYQLTDTTRIGFIYDAKTFKKAGEFHYPNDGWGLTTNGVYLIMSDGSSNITYHDPLTFATVKTLPVTDNNGPVANINELELIGGFLYANQWLTNYILKIDTLSGRVAGRLDLSALHQEARLKYPGSAEMNGIAYDPASGKIYVTGKLWPNIYEIRFDH